MLVLQAVVNEDALGTNLMLKAELQRVKVQLAALHGQPPALDAALATSLAFDDQPNTAAAQAAQVSLQSTCYTVLPSSVPCMAIPVFATNTRHRICAQQCSCHKPLLHGLPTVAAWVMDAKLCHNHCSEFVT